MIKYCVKYKQKVMSNHDGCALISSTEQVHVCRIPSGVSQTRLGVLSKADLVAGEDESRPHEKA